MPPVPKVKLAVLHPELLCKLCAGYLVDATTIIECLHSFCRTCIVRYLETSKFCPICDVQVHKTKPLLNIRPDKTLQDIVYKLVPGLYHTEMKRRREFYSERDEIETEEPEETTPEDKGEIVDRLIFSPDDSISLSLQYYEKSISAGDSEDCPSEEPNAAAQSSIQKRYLQCPAAVTVANLKKFIRMKFGLTPEYRVDLLYNDDCLGEDLTLMDVAYIYTWKRNGPMNFFYRIFELPRPRKRRAPPPQTPIKEEAVAEDPGPPPPKKPATEESSSTPSASTEPMDTSTTAPSSAPITPSSAPAAATAAEPPQPQQEQEQPQTQEQPQPQEPPQKEDKKKEESAQQQEVSSEPVPSKKKKGKGSPRRVHQQKSSSEDSNKVSAEVSKSAPEVSKVTAPEVCKVSKGSVPETSKVSKASLGLSKIAMELCRMAKDSLKVPKVSKVAPEASKVCRDGGVSSEKHKRESEDGGGDVSAKDAAEVSAAETKGCANKKEKMAVQTDKAPSEVPVDKAVVETKKCDVAAAAKSDVPEQKVPPRVEPQVHQQAEKEKKSKKCAEGKPGRKHKGHPSENKKVSANGHTPAAAAPVAPAAAEAADGVNTKEKAKEAAKKTKEAKSQEQEEQQPEGEDEEEEPRHDDFGALDLSGKSSRPAPNKPSTPVSKTPPSPTTSRTPPFPASGRVAGPGPNPGPNSCPSPAPARNGKVSLSLSALSSSNSGKFSSSCSRGSHPAPNNAHQKVYRGSNTGGGANNAGISALKAYRPAKAPAGRGQATQTILSIAQNLANRQLAISSAAGRSSPSPSPTSLPNPSPPATTSPSSASSSLSINALAMRNLMTLSDTAVHVQNQMALATKHSPTQRQPAPPPPPPPALPPPSSSAASPSTTPTPSSLMSLLSFPPLRPPPATKVTRSPSPLRIPIVPKCKPASSAPTCNNHRTTNAIPSSAAATGNSMNSQLYNLLQTTSSAQQQHHHHHQRSSSSSPSSSSLSSMLSRQHQHQHHLHQRLNPIPNQNIRQIPNPALLFRQWSQHNRMPFAMENNKEASSPQRKSTGSTTTAASSTTTSTTTTTTTGGHFSSSTSTSSGSPAFPTNPPASGSSNNKTAVNQHPSSIKKMENMARNLERVAQGLTLRAEAGAK